MALRWSQLRKTHLLHLAVLAALFSGMLYYYGEIEHTEKLGYRPYRALDFPYYRAMAEASPGFASAERPFVYRVLVPFIAGLLPLPLLTAFHLLGAVFVFVLTGLFHAYFCHFGTSPPIAAFVTALVLLNKWVVGYCLWNSYQAADLLSLGLLVVMFWAMLEERWLVFGVAMFVGVLARETAVLMIPVAVVCLLEKGKPRVSWSSFVLVTAPAVVCFVAVRLLAQADGGTTLRTAFFRYAGKKLTTPMEWVDAWIKPVAPFTFLPFVFFGTTLAFFRERKNALVAAIVQEHLWGNKLLLGLMVCAAFVSTVRSWFTRFPLENAVLTFTVILLSIFAVTGGALIHRVLDARRVEAPLGAPAGTEP